ncbi:hypothetical protein ALC60_09674 [Trachymyrmex zeteki]|uniref:Uncharacterized protein n=1 Tax=Mycetomoellerius zeteki TaxID=64791 RepID=A0A151WTH9_9HYME|nr:hypothetical protein ALC60_09674 [Trachymyrmex zeteki]
MRVSVKVDLLVGPCDDQVYGIINGSVDVNARRDQEAGVPFVLRGNLLWDPLKDYLRRRVQSHLQKTIQPPIQVNRYLMNVCSKVQDFKEPALRKRQNKKNARKNIKNDKKREERRRKRINKRIKEKMKKRKDKSVQFVTPIIVRYHKFRKKILLPGRFRCTS